MVVSLLSEEDCFKLFSFVLEEEEVPHQIG